jgi:DNA-binding PucR family transcriptional regulator
MASLARYGMEMSAMQERPTASVMTSDALNELLPRGDQNLSGPHLNLHNSPPSMGSVHRLLTSLWRALAGTNASHRRLCSPPYYLEYARLSREIDRL